MIQIRLSLVLLIASAAYLLHRAHQKAAEPTIIGTHIMALPNRNNGRWDPSGAWKKDLPIPRNLVGTPARYWAGKPVQSYILPAPETPTSTITAAVAA